MRDLKTHLKGAVSHDEYQNEVRRRRCSDSDHAIHATVSSATVSPSRNKPTDIKAVSPKHFFPNSPSSKETSEISVTTSKASLLASPFAFLLGNRSKSQDEHKDAEAEAMKSQPALKVAPIKASSILAGPLTAALGLAWLSRRCHSLVLLTARRSSCCLEFISRYHAVHFCCCL